MFDFALRFGAVDSLRGLRIRKKAVNDNRESAEKWPPCKE